MNEAWSIQEIREKIAVMQEKIAQLERDLAAMKASEVGAAPSPNPWEQPPPQYYYVGAR